MTVVYKHAVLKYLKIYNTAKFSRLNEYEFYVEEEIKNVHRH